MYGNYGKVLALFLACWYLDTFNLLLALQALGMYNILHMSGYDGYWFHMVSFPLQDFLSPHLKMFTDRDFGELGVNVDLAIPVPNMGDTGYGLRTESIDVLGGV